MDARHFDALSRALSAPDSRRRLLTLLATLPVLGGLLAFLDPAETDAQGRRKRRKKAHKHGRGRRRQRRKKKKSCTPDSVTQTCAAKCGPVTNNCKQPVDCGTCDCSPACGECFTCQGAVGVPGTCVPSPNGTTCGGGGSCCDGTCNPCPCDQVQRSNGTCVTLCQNASPCGANPCGCFVTPGICGTDQTGIPCPNGDIDCPVGQFCNTFNQVCATAC